MASNQTQHYQLSQWEAGDKVERLDFNADNGKIDAALHGLAQEVARKAGQSALAEKLGRSQVIKTVAAGTSSRRIVLDLSDISWDEWEYIGFWVDRISVPNSDTSCFYCHLNNGMTAAYNSSGISGFAYNGMSPFMILLLPHHEPGARVLGLCFGDHGGLCLGGCTFQELGSVTVILQSDHYYFPNDTEITLWGAK